MKNILKIWENYWFKEVTQVNIVVFRFILLSLGSIFHWNMTKFNYTYDPNPETYYAVWQPISFYKLFASPISNQTLLILKYIWLSTSFIAGLGIFYRHLIIVSFLSGVIYLGHDYNFGTVGHSNHLYAMSLGILAVSALFELYSTNKKDSDQHISFQFNWPLQLIKLYIVYMYFILGVEKLWYGGGLSWAFSESFYLRIFTNPHLTFFGAWVLEQPLYVSQFLAAFALLVVEIGAPIALLNRKLNFTFVILWSMFHVMVTLSFGKHYSFYSQIFCYLAFIDWEFLFKKYAHQFEIFQLK